MSLRNTIIELGGLPQGTEEQKFKAFCTTLFTAGGMFIFGATAGLFGYVLGVGAMAAGDVALSQALLAGLCLWAGATVGKGAQAALQFAALMADTKPDAPRQTRPLTRAIGQKWLPLAAGAVVAVSTSFAMASRLPQPGETVQPRPVSSLNTGGPSL